jgi:Xaa-Pro aminopeptidase
MKKIDYREFKRRRKALMAKMRPNSIALIASAAPKIRNANSEYPYRQNSDFYYLTGFTESQALLALIPGRKKGEAILFCQGKNREKEIWSGNLTGPKKAKQLLLLDEAFAFSMADSTVPGLLDGCERIYYGVGKDPHFEQQVMEWLNNIRGRVRQGARPPGEFLMLDPLLHELRVIKSGAEIKLMEKAANISASAHNRAMKFCKPGFYEYQLEAEMLHEFVRQGSRSPAYNFIIASGANACILHYNCNKSEIKDGDLVLIDAGCEYGNYASDITRTFPANGKFTLQQKAVYQIVLNAQTAAIESLKPGAYWDAPINIAIRVITAGLVKLGLLKGKLDQLIKSQAYREFYMHGVGHFLGLDVHDVGDQKINGKWRQYAPGMVTTIEPGIYISPDNKKVGKAWRGIGVRIEDDVLITKKGHKVLSKAAPKTIKEIESIMSAARKRSSVGAN